MRILNKSLSMRNEITAFEERSIVARRIIIVGGGAAGMGAAGAAQGVDPDAKITVFTSYEDAAYSPCGIPYVHGKEIPAFENLFLATGFEYADPGVPGGDLGGIYYVKNIRRAMEWDVVLDGF